MLLFALRKPAINNYTMNNMQSKTRSRKVQWSKQIRIVNLSMSVCLYAHLDLCPLFPFEEELYLFSAEITVRRKTFYCRDGTEHTAALPQSL